MLHSFDQPGPGERRRSRFAHRSHLEALEKASAEAYEQGLQEGLRRKVQEMQPKIDEVITLLLPMSSSPQGSRLKGAKRHGSRR